MVGTFVKSNGWDAYVAKGKFALGVVVIHEVWGFNDYPKSVADAIASSGYSAVAIDFYKGRSGKTLVEASKIRDSLSRNDVLGAISAGCEVLKGIGATKLGTLGFCMGGGFALLGACNDPGVTFCVDYYGSIQNENETANLKCPVLLILGTEDPNITPWAWTTFLPAAAKHNKRIEVQLYSGAKHGFHNKWGPNYNEAAANDAWTRTLDFLSREQ